MKKRRVVAKLSKKEKLFLKKLLRDSAKSYARSLEFFFPGVVDEEEKLVAEPAERNLSFHCAHAFLASRLVGKAVAFELTHSGRSKIDLLLASEKLVIAAETKRFFNAISVKQVVSDIKKLSRFRFPETNLTYETPRVFRMILLTVHSPKGVAKKSDQRKVWKNLNILRARASFFHHKEKVIHSSLQTTRRGGYSSAFETWLVALVF